MCTSAGTAGDVDPNVFETANAGFAQAMYEEFLPLQKSTLAAGWELIPGVIDTIARLRARPQPY